MSLSELEQSVPGLASRRKAFRALHERGCFVIPNPWDVGSARYLQHLGFPALAINQKVSIRQRWRHR